MSKISLSDTQKVGVRTLISYREISEQYPYCSCAKTLYLLSLKKLKDPDFDKILSQTAVSVPDRKRLEELIKSFSPSQKSIGSILKESKSNADSRFFSFVPVADEIPTVEDTPAVEANAEKVAVVDNRVNKTVIAKEQAHFNIGDYSNAGNTISDIFFTENSEAEEPVKSIEAANTYEAQTLTGSLLAQMAQAKSHIPADIDKFLNNPNEHKAIKVDKNKNYSQIVISDSSTKEDLSIGTETMARLYAEQGHSQKAEIIYRNLIEKHPGKALYYNTLIKKLKSQ